MELDRLHEHLLRGGAATLNVPAVYSVAQGAVVAPARYSGRNGSEFVFETRFVDGAFRRTVLIDSKQSQSNRAEEGLLSARREGHAAAQIPVIEVEYAGREPLSDLELPHRAYDAHVRFASQEGEPVVERKWYQDLRDATHADLSSLFVTAPSALTFGAWDSTRKSGQVRLRSLFVSELFGVVDDHENRLSRRSGARLDPLGQDFNVSLSEFEVLLDMQREYLSPNQVEKREKELDAAKKKKSATLSASGLNVGGIPPGLETPFGVSVPEVRRVRTFSLAGLRRLRFGGDADDDARARAALLGMMLLGAAYADADPDLRAYCDVSAPRAEVFLDDEKVDLDLSTGACGAFLAEAVNRLPDRLKWRGQVQRVVGDVALNRGAAEASADEE